MLTSQKGQPFERCLNLEATRRSGLHNQENHHDSTIIFKYRSVGHSITSGPWHRIDASKAIGSNC
jgi:hypothetical protein